MAHEFVEKALSKLPMKGIIDLSDIDSALEEVYPELLNDPARVAVGRQIPVDRQAPNLRDLLNRS